MRQGHKRRLLSACVWFIALSAAVCLSEEGTSPQANPLKTLSLEQLADVEVTTVSKEPEQVWRTPAAVTVLTSEDIRRSGFTTVADVLRLVPGVDIGRNDSIGYSVGIRGFQNVFSKALLVLIDGRSMYTTLFAGVYWDVVNQLPLENIDRIEIIRGPGTTIWGANAVNGVINIITKRAQDTHGGYVSVGGGNVDQGRAFIRYGGNHGSLDYQVYGNWFTIGPEFHFAPGRVNNYDDWWNVQGGFRADWNKSDRDTITLQGASFIERNGEQVDIAFFNATSLTSVIGRSRTSGGDLLLNWKHKISDTSNFQLQTYYDKVDRDRPQFGEKRDNFDIDFIHHFVLGAWNDVIWGAGFRVTPDHTSSHHPGSVDFLPSDRTEYLYTGFVQDEFRLTPKSLSLTAGVKLEHNDYTGFEYQPTARLLYHPQDHRTFWASVTRAVRTPSRLDQDLSIAAFVAPSLFFRILGERSFKSEVTIDYEVGFRQLISSKLFLDLAAFRNNYHGLESVGPASIIPVINPAPTHLEFTVPFVNGASGPSEGGEIAATWHATDHIRLTASYSYIALHLRSTVGALGNGVALNFTHSAPRNRVVVAPRFTFAKRFEFDPSYFYTSATASDASFPVKAYHSLTTRLGWNTDHLELSVTGDNLLQPHHVEASSKPFVGIRRSVFGRIAWRW